MSLDYIQLEEKSGDSERRTIDQFSLNTGKPTRISQNQSKGEKIYSFDHVLSDIGIGPYQYLLYIIMGTLGLTQGSQITVFTLMIPILEKEWGVSDTLNQLQTSLIFVGFILGSLISGRVVDKFGRRRPFLYSTFLTAALTLCQVLCFDIYSLIILRTLTGVLVGFFGPLGVTLLTELTPLEVRGKYMSIITVSLNVGQIFGFVIGTATLQGLSSGGNWRMLIIITGAPGLFAWFLGLKYLDDSVRFELLDGKYTSAFRTIKKIIVMNSSPFLLTEEIETDLINWSESINKNWNQEEQASVQSLFKGKGQIITPLVWTNWFTLSFMYYGIFIMLPVILKKRNEVNDWLNKDNEIQLLLLSSGSEIVAGALASLLIVIKGLGRKNVIIVMYIMQGTAAFLTYQNDTNFLVWATVSRFFNTITFIFTYQFTAELYPTQTRTTGVGLANGIGRVGGVVMPWICFSMANDDLYSPFLVFSSLSYLTSILDLAFPFDTEGRELDTANSN